MPKKKKEEEAKTITITKQNKLKNSPKEICVIENLSRDILVGGRCIYML